MADLNAFLTIATAFSAFISPYIKITLDRRLNILSNKHRKYQFIKEFINNINRMDEIHPLVIQHGASILFGGYLDKDHVKHLLKLRVKTHMLLNYGGIRTFIEYNIISSNLIYKKKYRKPRQRKIKKIEYLINYSLFAGFPLVLFMYFPVFSSGITTAIKFVIGSLLCFALAYFTLISYFSLRDAEEVVKASSEISNLY